MQEARQGDDFVSKESEELLLLSEPSGHFCVSIPGMVLPGPSVNKAIRYGSSSVTPQTHCWSLPPPWAPSAPALPVLCWELCSRTGVIQMLIHTWERPPSIPRVITAPAGTGAEPEHPHCSFCKTGEHSEEFRDTDALPGRDMEESWVLFILTRE